MQNGTALMANAYNMVYSTRKIEIRMKNFMGVSKWNSRIAQRVDTKMDVDGFDKFEQRNL
jgi:hypothetical protein